MNITALIVTYNRLDKLKQTIKATLELPFSFVVVVNNASTDQTKVWLDAIDDKRLIIIDEKLNLGGAGGFRAGSKFISENLLTDWITFYDDDAWPAKDFISNFVKNKPDTDSVYCGRVLDNNGQDCKMNIPWKKRPINFCENLGYFFDQKKFIINPLVSDEAITFSFVGVVISNKILSKYWMEIQDQLFIYYDDILFSWFLKRQDISIKYISSLVYLHDIHHYKNGLLPSWKVYYLVRNLILSRKIYGDCSFYSRAAIWVRVLKYLLLGVKQKEKVKYYRYIILGVLDGLRNISGKRH